MDGGVVVEGVADEEERKPIGDGRGCERPRRGWGDRAHKQNR